MTRPWTLYAGLGALAIAGFATAGSIGTAAARVTVLDDDADTVARIIGTQPGGAPGLRLEDNLYQVAATPSPLPAVRQATRVSGGAPTTADPSLLGRSPAAMADVLRARIQSAGSHRVFVDDIGGAWEGQDGQNLAEALDILSRERPSWAPQGVSRRVHLYVSSPGPLLSDSRWAGARLATVRSGGVWLKTFAGESEWTGAQWLAWPSEAAEQLAAGGSLRSRVHVVFTGTGGQSAAWALARAGSACEMLGNGPGAYRLGSYAATFVTEYRRAFPNSALFKEPVAGCVAAPQLSQAGARGLEAAQALEGTGVEIPPGGLVTPPLSAGEPAQLTLQLGADPLGLAGALGVTPERFWTAAQARLEVRGPGVSTDVTIEGDGAARIAFTPAAPGPVTMRVVIGQSAISRALGGEPDLVPSLHRAGVGGELLARVVADPSGWQLTVPLVRPGDSPGAPVLEIVPPPA